MTKKQLLFTFLWLGILVFIVYRKSLSLSLYGDDWLAISKYLGGYGPGKDYGYLHPQVWISNYGFQNLPAFIYLVWGSNPLPYFIINLLLRTLSGLGVFIFTRKVYETKVALLAASFYAISSIGAETTDWVYNMNTYLGIFVALVGLSYFMYRKSSKELISGIFLTLLGYVIVPIRLYIVPMLLFILEILKGFIRLKKVQVRIYMSVFWKAFVVVGLPFIFLKVFFPFAGFQPVNSDLVRNGISLAKSMIGGGRFDFFLYPFATIGRMILPVSLNELEKIGWSITPFSNFVKYGSFLALGGVTLVSLVIPKNKRLPNLVTSFAICSIALVVLKLFVKYQGRWQLTTLPFFIWTYLGIVFVGIILFTISRMFIERKSKRLIFFITGFAFLLSFLFPWLYNPTITFESQHRYLALSAVGVSLLVGGLMRLGREDMSKRFLIFAVLALLSIFQVQSVDRFFEYQLRGRTKELNDRLFTEIQSFILELPQDTSVFYFEDFPPLVYEQLLRFGFGYHMQLLYDFEFNELKHPFSVSTRKDLVSAVGDASFTKRLGYESVPSIDSVYAFRWEDDRMVDITSSTRDYLFNEIKSNEIKSKEIKKNEK